MKVRHWGHGSLSAKGQQAPPPYRHAQLWNPSPAAAAAAKLLQTLLDLIDGSPPGSPVPWILQARTLE